MFPSRKEPSRYSSSALMVCTQNSSLFFIIFNGQGLWKQHGLGTMCTLIQILALLMISCVTPGSSINLTEPQFPICEMGMISLALQGG